MLPPLYGLVTYVQGPIGEMVESLRRELHPEHGHVSAHISILPPRLLAGSEDEALAMLERTCRNIAPFEIAMGEVESFMPTTPTIFIRVAHAAYKMRELHDLLDSGPLAFQEPLPYMPHLTIGKLESLERARKVFELARERWQQFSGPRTVLIENLSFVRGRDATWVDLAPVHLGGLSLVNTSA